MGFDPQEIDYFTYLAEKGYIPSNLNSISVIEIGNGCIPPEEQLKEKHDFLPQGNPITTRQWIFGLLSQKSFKDKL